MKNKEKQAQSLPKANINIMRRRYKNR